MAIAPANHSVAHANPRRLTIARTLSRAEIVDPHTSCAWQHK